MIIRTRVTSFIIMLKFHVFLIFFYIFLINHVNCANILCLISVPSPSHLLWMKVLIKGLSEQGHNLTVLSVNVDKVSLANVHYIHLENVNSQLNELNIMDLSTENFFKSISAFHKADKVICEGNNN